MHRSAIAIVVAAAWLAATPADAARKKSRNTAPPADDASERELQADLDAIMAERTFAGSHTGVYVVDVASGRVLYAVAADEPLNPASNTKIVSTATALDALGPAFTYKTRVYGPAPDEGGVVKGDLWLVGMGDPTLGDDGLVQLARTLAEHGVHRVTGAIVVADDPERDAVARPRFDVTVQAGGDEGALAQVTLSPDSAYFVVEDTAQISKKAPVKQDCKRVKVGNKKERRCGPTRPAALTVRTDPDPGSDGRGPAVVVKVAGKLRPGALLRLTRDAPDPAPFTAHALRAHLQSLGVAVDGGVRVVALDAARPAGLVELGVHESVPLGELVAWINKPSNNFLADRLIRTVGALQAGGAATFEAGTKAMAAFLAKVGVDGSWVLENGSGLTYNNRISVKQIATVLVAVFKDPRIASEFVASLSIAGKDGTLRGRFKGLGAIGFARAKTGTLTGVAAMSGFVSVDGSHVLCYAIVSNGYGNRRKQTIRQGQDRLVDAMYRHLRRVEKAEGKPPAPAAAWPTLPGAEPVPGDVPEPDDEAEHAPDEPAATAPADGTAAPSSQP
jgi:D-alanyl-D-alanine carboxypeptidase/D-alanyl-D-alanine-endopeptidase (penicillin-binding protein 4)